MATVTLDSQIHEYAMPNPGHELEDVRSWVYGTVSTSRGLAGSPTSVGTGSWTGCAAKRTAGPGNLAEGRRTDRSQVRGHSFIHHAVDDQSRYVYSDETQATASAFMTNAITAHGVPCYLQREPVSPGTLKSTFRSSPSTPRPR